MVQVHHSLKIPLWTSLDAESAIQDALNSAGVAAAYQDTAWPQAYPKLRLVLTKPIDWELIRRQADHHPGIHHEPNRIESRRAWLVGL